MTLVPDPGLAGGAGAEVGPPHVVDARGESEQPAVPVGPVHASGGGRQAVLFVGAGEQVQRPILQVGRLLDQLSVDHQVGGRWSGGGGGG